MRGDLKKKSKTNLTISLDNNLLEEIKIESQDRGMSINAYLNESLQRYILFYRHVIKQGGLVIPRGFFVSLLDLIDEEKINKIFEREGGYDVVISILAQNKIPVTLDNLIRYVFEGISFWAGAYNKFSHQKDKNYKTRLFFEHRYGIKWSNAFGSETTRLISQYTGLSTVYKSTSTMVTITVDHDS
jgi:hypothetical protein